jgi:hypothetical protein
MEIIWYHLRTSTKLSAVEIVYESMISESVAELGRKSLDSSNQVKLGIDITLSVNQERFSTFPIRNVGIPLEVDSSAIARHLIMCPAPIESEASDRIIKRTYARLH